MKNPTVKYHDVSAQCYDLLLNYLSEAEGCTVNGDNNEGQPTSSITGPNTQINLTHDPKDQSLTVEYAEVPQELETYYLGHLFELIQLINQSLNEQQEPISNSSGMESNNIFKRWMVTINIKNELGTTMTLNDASLSHGWWQNYPKRSLAPAHSETVTRVNDKWTHRIPKGVLRYGTPDGTVYIIRFGFDGKNIKYLHCTASGPRAGIYSIDINSSIKDKNFIGTITISS